MTSPTDDWFGKAQEEVIKAQASDEVKQKAVTWNPDAGELLKGKLVDVDPYASSYGDVNYRMYVENVDKDNELTLVFASRTSIRRELEDSAPKKGTLLVVQYFGKIPIEGTDRSYHSYKVRAKDQDFEWWQQMYKKGSRLLHDKAKASQVSGAVEFDGPEEDPF